MRVLVVGASGFIGSAVVAALQRAGLETRCVVRDAKRFRRRFPRSDVRALDLTSRAAQSTHSWAGLVDAMDAVVYVAGVLQPRDASEAWAVHRDAPRALYEACESAGVCRIVHVSAIGVEETDTVYAKSKRAGEELVMTGPLDWTLLRPAVVVGDGSYGGTSLLRAIAVFPFVTPVIDDGTTPMDTIHKDDLAAGIVRLLRTGRGVRTILEPAGATRLTFAQTVFAYRAWFGLPARPVVGVPFLVAAMLARFGDLTRMHPMTSTALAQFRTRLTGDACAFEEVTGIAPRGLAQVLSSRPCESQDLWHARLFLLRPLVRLSLAALWAVSGVLGLFADPAQYAFLFDAPVSGHAKAIAVAASVADLAIALALVRGWRSRLMAWMQMAMILGYTVGLSLLAPVMWADPFGALLKNVPILVLVLVHRILEEER